jgi:hypothetical protein
VLEGFTQALDMITADHPDHACLTRCYRLCCQMTGQRPLSPVNES